VIVNNFVGTGVEVEVEQVVEQVLPHLEREAPLFSFVSEAIQTNPFSILE
jgi:hypothetical protein